MFAINATVNIDSIIIKFNNKQNEIKVPILSRSSFSSTKKIAIPESVPKLTIKARKAVESKKISYAAKSSGDINFVRMGMTNNVINFDPAVEIK